MTLEAYITRQPNGDESAFDHPFKRQGALHVVKALWRAFHDSPTHVAVVVNAGQPAVDMAILSSDGLGIVALEGYGQPVGGRDDTEWALLDSYGRPFMRIPREGGYLNPFDKVRAQRRRIYGSLRTFAEAHAEHLPPWLIDGRYELQGAVVFTAVRFDLARIIIDPAEGQPWFGLAWADETPDWVRTLDFGKNRQTDRMYRLENPHVEYLVTRYFQASRWHEVQKSLHSGEVYGTLWVLIEGREHYPLPLDQTSMTIGRLPTNAIALDSDTYPQVSREHASIRNLSGEIFLGDLGSKHGTWLNGRQIAPEMEMRVQNGDRIILGAAEENGKAAPGACTLVYRARR